jgi:hypothetical protein
VFFSYINDVGPPNAIGIRFVVHNCLSMLQFDFSQLVTHLVHSIQTNPDSLDETLVVLCNQHLILSEFPWLSRNVDEQC